MPRIDKIPTRVALGALAIALGLLAGGALSLYQYDQRVGELFQRQTQLEQELKQSPKCDCNLQRQLLLGAWLSLCSNKVLRPSDAQFTWCSETQGTLNKAKLEQ